MRTIICVTTFIVLLLTGFLATPGIFKIVNPEYLLALREFGRPLAKLSIDSSDADAKISELRSRISKLERLMKDTGNAAMAKQASLKNANAPANEIAAVGIEAGSQITAFSAEKEQVEAELTTWKETKASIAASQAELRKKIETAASDSANIYIVARALALGAIGALMSIFAKYLTGPPRPLFEDSASMGRMWASMAMGGIVSVVVIGLFFTGFISIFANAPQTSSETDFWKVTILCLIAGAFSDRLFQAAAGRVESYLQADQGGAGVESRLGQLARHKVHTGATEGHQAT